MDAGVSGQVFPEDHLPARDLHACVRLAVLAQVDEDARAVEHRRLRALRDDHILEQGGDTDLLPEGDVLVDAARPEYVARIGRAIGRGSRPTRLGRGGGRLLAAVLARVPLARAGVAGGDTSSHAVLGLDAWGLSFVRRLAPGVSLCRLHSDRPGLDGLELMLKGGQMGDDDLFERLLRD